MLTTSQGTCSLPPKVRMPLSHHFTGAGNIWDSQTVIEVFWKHIKVYKPVMNLTLLSLAGGKEQSPGGKSHFLMKWWLFALRTGHLINIRDSSGVVKLRYLGSIPKPLPPIHCYLNYNQSQKAYSKMALAKNTGSRHSWQKLKSMAYIKSQIWNLGSGLNVREKTVFTQHTKLLEKIYFDSLSQVSCSWFIC